eukprot:1837086-Prymnesium_polylepis.1
MASALTWPVCVRPSGGERRTYSANATSVARFHMAPTPASAPMAGMNGVRPVASRKPSNQTSAVRSRGMSHASIARPSAASSSSAVKMPPA